MISRNGRPSLCLPSSRKVTVVGAAPDHLADPEDEDEFRVAPNSVVIAEIELTTVIIDELGWPAAERRQFAPYVEAKHSDRDDRGQVEAAAAAIANASHKTGLHDPSASKHAARVDGKEQHSRATKCIDHAESVALRPAIIPRIVCTAFIFDVHEVLFGVVVISIKVLVW